MEAIEREAIDEGVARWRCGFFRAVLRGQTRLRSVTNGGKCSRTSLSQ